ncbi:MAG: CAP domain-containing protein [Candidatus Eremiobacter antarcticus]|nr:CAP domain-containing protein [Candidatus Eremiobacteraeota bacterium]MBC5808934.1 CAP domain-containing protein [Candidatus Eremiobacteraeota bacterium]
MTLLFLSFLMSAALMVANLSPVSHLTGGTSGITAPQASNKYAQPIGDRLIQQINAHRASAGLPPLQQDPIAQQAAQLQAQDMEINGVMQHQDRAGRSPMTRYAALGGHPSVYGENVASYTDAVTQAEAQWHVIAKLDGMMMAEKPPSDGHRENILSHDYTAVGVGVAVGPHGLFVAEDFVSFN